MVTVLLKLIVMVSVVEIAVEDCSGQCGGTAVEDACGVCDGDGFTCEYGCVEGVEVCLSLDGSNLTTQVLLILLDFNLIIMDV